MLTTTKHAPKRAATATLPPASKASVQDLALLSVNQQLEGFPGEITEAVATYEPNMEEIAERAKRRGAQVPSEANRRRPPLFPRPKS